MATKGKSENSFTFMVNLSAQKFNQISIYINVHFNHECLKSKLYNHVRPFE